MRPYDIVEAFEERVADYAGSLYAVAVNSCTSALMIATRIRMMEGFIPSAQLPKRTYVGVPNAMIAAGCQVYFFDMDWSGAYEIEPLAIVDAARRFRRGMYEDDTLYCLSFHWGKHLKIGRGGMILTDDAEEAKEMRRLRYDGRAPGVHPKDDDIGFGWHVYMIPEDAARGLMLMNHMPDDNDDLPWDDYPDCSKIEEFKEGRWIG